MSQTQVDLVQQTKLSNGLTVVSEHIPGVKSVAVGIWVKTGSRNETEEVAGITHFLEHMLFKGTESRSSYDIALSMESVGGYLNAFTSSEYTCYYARCLDEELDRAVDVLSDMILHPLFPEDEMEKEKKVVLEEMKMYRDNPQDFAFEQFNRMLFEGDALGRPVIGDEKSVQALTRDDLFNYMDQRYFPSNLVVSVAGAVGHDALLQQIQKRFEDLHAKKEKVNGKALSQYQATSDSMKRSIEQTHYLLGRRALEADHEDKYTLLLANTILGGGMSARLHQNIREQHGYCYNIQTFNQVYSDTGIFGIYAGTDREYVKHMRSLIFEELHKMRETKVPEKELEQAKTQLKGKLLLSQENTSSRMSRLAKSMIYFDRFITLDELVEHIDEVSAAHIQQFADTFFREKAFSEFRLEPETGDEKPANI